MFILNDQMSEVHSVSQDAGTGKTSVRVAFFHLHEECLMSHGSKMTRELIGESFSVITISDTSLTSSSSSFGGRDNCSSQLEGGSVSQVGLDPFHQRVSREVDSSRRTVGWVVS